MKIKKDIKVVVAVGLVFAVVGFGLWLVRGDRPTVNGGTSEARFWEVQAIDTMKYSRDVAREKMKDVTFDDEIEKEVKNIAGSGATHVAIGTPYDEEFLPFMERWVKAARRYGLKVWFRGNFSGWEGWFGYAKIGRDEHLAKVESFILGNGYLFEDGDIFSPCTECENGGPGDPRQTGDVGGFRDFIVSEHEVSRKAFEKIGKKVKSNYFSMNGDVARLVMDKETTAWLSGIVVIDHYVGSAEKMADDIEEIAKRSGGRVVVGEFGVPIPDIHGEMTEEEQAAWLEGVLRELVSLPEVVGINYWVYRGGATSLWRSDHAEREAVGVLRSYYKPKVLTGVAVNSIGRPVGTVEVTDGVRIAASDGRGRFEFIIAPGTEKVRLASPGYEVQELALGEETEEVAVKMEKKDKDGIYRIIEKLYSMLNNRFY